VNKDFLQLIKGCMKCTLCAQCSGPVPPVTVDSPVMIIGRNPGEQEDKGCGPFADPAGKLFDQFLSWAGLDCSQCYATNLVKCWTRIPFPNRAPERHEIKACSPWLQQEVGELKPKLVLAVGTEVLGLFRSGAKPGRYHGKALVVRREPWATLLASTTVFGTYHPLYILRNSTEMMSVYEDDAQELRKIVEELEL